MKARVSCLGSAAFGSRWVCCDRDIPSELIVARVSWTARVTRSGGAYGQTQRHEVQTCSRDAHPIAGQGGL